MESKHVLTTTAVIGTDINQATQALEQGKLVALPTETVYGLAANGLDATAVAGVFAAKNRPAFNPLILHTNNFSRFAEWGLELPETMLALAKVFSPGPLTYVVPQTSNLIPDLVTAGTHAVAIRVPKHPLTLKLLAKLPFPVAAPSANKSGYVSPTTAAHVAQQMGAEVAYILDGGACEVGVESTIVSFLNNQVELLRYGGVSVEAIEAVVGKIKLPQQGFVDNPVAPGQLAKHYATKIPLVHGQVETRLKMYNPNEVGILSFTKTYLDVPAQQQLVLSPTGNLVEAAQKLFAAMRTLDEMNIAIILAEVFPNEGLGRAINDRLHRASIHA
ncbi:MAG: L-threonylcarbamoyladenylate synthase [Bacteroidia bacterium]|nr:L-threonylcarbamoyladenylate synthase [Bacteroidia bacterium]